MTAAEGVAIVIAFVVLVIVLVIIAITVANVTASHRRELELLQAQVYYLEEMRSGRRRNREPVPPPFPLAEAQLNQFGRRRRG